MQTSSLGLRSKAWDSAYLLWRQARLLAPSLDYSALLDWVLEAEEVSTIAGLPSPLCPVILDNDLRPVGVLVTTTATTQYGLVLAGTSPVASLITPPVGTRVADRWWMLGDWQRRRQVALALEYPIPD